MTRHQIWPLIRKLAFQDLDECMYEILKDSLAYLEENPKDVDTTTKEAFLYYKDLHIKRASRQKRRSTDEQRTGNGKACLPRS